MKKILIQIIRNGFRKTLPISVGIYANAFLLWEFAATADQMTQIGQVKRTPKPNVKIATKMEITSMMIPPDTVEYNRPKDPKKSSQRIATAMLFPAITTFCTFYPSVISASL